MRLERDRSDVNRGFLVAIALLALAFAALTGIAVRKGVLATSQQAAAVGGPFQLVDQAGRPADESVLRGKWSAVFFGFTYCPDVCPTTMFALGQAEKLLGSKAAKFQTIFISVDPARDSPRQLALYLTNDAFPRHVVGLTGDKTQVAAAARAYKVFYQQQGAGPDSQFNHSTITYLMNPKGRLACVLPSDLKPEEIAAKVSAAMAQGESAASC